MSQSILNQGLRVLEIESRAILALRSQINGSFVEAVNLISKTQGKLVVTGIGKSGHVARKIASTFSSTGTPAIFLHPAESSHGDLGLLSAGDCILALSNGGESKELLAVIGFAARKNIPLIAMTGSKESTLGRSANIILETKVAEEACPLGMAPTASTTASLALGDSLAMAVLQEKGFTLEDYAETHPGGQLGIRLKRVRDVMQDERATPLVNLETPVREVISLMTHKDVRGAACVVDANGDLAGLITDGEIRRRLEKNQNPLEGKARDLMTLNPRTIDASELVEKALFVMEQFRIQFLFVLDKGSSQPKKPRGYLNFHDLLFQKNA